MPMYDSLAREIEYLILAGATAYRFEGFRTVRFDLDEIDASLKPSIGQGVES